MTLRFALPLLPIALGWVSPLSAQARQGPEAHGDVRQFYSTYEAALKAHRRDTLAHFYDPRGALIVINGARMSLSSAQIDSTYRGPWQGPVFFAFENLQFHTLSSAQVVVTGGFRWLSRQSTDTTSFVYLALLDRSPSGLRIRVEHETQRPARPR